MSDYGYGEKIEYLTIRLPDTDRNWCYSAEMLKAELNSLLVGQRIQAVCVSLAGCVYALYHAPNIIDLSYLGGSSLLLFEKTALELSFYAVGMLGYRLFPVWEAKLRRVYGYVPRESLPSDDLFIDASKCDITHDFAGRQISGAEIIGADYWSIDNSSFDAEKAGAAAEKSDLPAEIILSFDGGRIRFESEEMENYRVCFEFDSKSKGCSE